MNNTSGTGLWSKGINIVSEQKDVDRHTGSGRTKMAAIGCKKKRRRERSWVKQEKKSVWWKEKWKTKNRIGGSKDKTKFQEVMEVAVVDGFVGWKKWLISFHIGISCSLGRLWKNRGRMRYKKPSCVGRWLTGQGKLEECESVSRLGTMKANFSASYYIGVD